MNETNLLLVLFGIALFALFSGPISRGNLTPPMTFTALGLVLSPIALGWISLGLDNTVIHAIAEITLILVLFTDAARIKLKTLWSDHDLPIRLLLVGMPLSIGLGAAFALAVMPQLSLLEALVLAVILAPTDAALGQAVVSSPKVPQRIRQTLNVESGLNDGIALPALLFVISFAAINHGGEDETDWLNFVLLQLTLGPLVGVLIGWLGSRAINKAIEKHFLTHEFCNIYLLTMAFIAYLAADLVGGNGFIAAFTAGIATGNTLKHVNEEIYEFAESEGQLLNLVIFFLFGVSLLPQVWPRISGEMIAYALLSLTLVRMLPMFISLVGKRLRWETSLFLGWFGPRGLASILFVLLVLEHAQLSNQALIFDIVILTVFFSIFLHGLSALPGVNLYATALKVCQRRGDDISSEQAQVEPMPLRLASAFKGKQSR
ncbi:MAG: sodium:proton antiporter [Candidatus Thiodiazotropha sp. (ex Ctena orbiculata)]|nr:sodium:proton antiporter [Candidatus Thiodiazotropha taylori]MBT2997279.1 sodium:proton antiporter [Candidatus Thiodiazotropha taylori]MBT3001011.1 sodium:proton antiporter [Candidatus Thiodiazotropha taylori]MBV2108275.1 sodium:proton antiporter [Candidatus Thiodiazotropha taylori]MBV2111864.1 sodium:proton antiporter [Candidatus Thiodiazotropha taylori]